MGAFGRLLIQSWGGNLKAYDNAGCSPSIKETKSVEQIKEETDELDRLNHLNEIISKCKRYNNSFRVDESWFEFDDGTIDVKSFEEFKQWRGY